MMRTLLCLLLLGFSYPVAAQPSFRCTGDLTETERAICNDRVLARLDVQMASEFRDIFRRLSGDVQRAFRRDQLLWQRWRATCGANTSCLKRRYEQRIIDLVPSSAPQSGGLQVPVGPDDVVEKRVRDGRFETLFGDGRIEWSDGGCFGTDLPGQPGVPNCALVVGGIEFPGLPGNLTEWGGALEENLLGIVDTLLPPQDRGPYRDLFEGQSYDQRIDKHLDVIEHLVSK